MPIQFINVTTPSKTTISKLGDVTVVDNDADRLPTVWKTGPSVLADTTDPELEVPSNVWHPGLICVPPADVVISADVLSGDFPLEVTFSAVIGEGSTPLTYLWDFGDGNTSTEESPTHTYTTEAEFTVSLTVTNECGTAESNELTVEVADPGVLFDDTFTGAAGALTAHTPDIAPVGFVWATITGDGHDLTGTGKIISPDNGDGITDSSGSSPAFSLSPTFPYWIEMWAEHPAVPAVIGEGAAFVYFHGGLWHQINLGTGGGGPIRAVYANSSSQSMVHTLPGLGAYKLGLKVINQFTYELYVDDVLVLSRNDIAAGSTDPIDRVYVQAAAEPGAKYTISRVRIRLD